MVAPTKVESRPGQKPPDHALTAAMAVLRSGTPNRDHTACIGSISRPCSDCCVATIVQRRVAQPRAVRQSHRKYSAEVSGRALHFSHRLRSAGPDDVGYDAAATNWRNDGSLRGIDAVVDPRHASRLGAIWRTVGPEQRRRGGPPGAADRPADHPSHRPPAPVAPV